MKKRTHDGGPSLIRLIPACAVGCRRGEDAERPGRIRPGDRPPPPPLLTADTDDHAAMAVVVKSRVRGNIGLDLL